MSATGAATDAAPAPYSPRRRRSNSPTQSEQLPHSPVSSPHELQASDSSPRQRSTSQSQYSRPAGTEIGNLVNVSGRDGEQLDLASAPPSTSPGDKVPQRRSSFAPGSEEPPKQARQSSRQRPSSKSTPSTRNSTEVPGSEARQVASASSATSTPQARRRTTIVMKTGEWTLGKTIGAGSVGKVKLARNMETGEQVSKEPTSRWIQIRSRPGH